MKALIMIVWLGISLVPASAQKVKNTKQSKDEAAFQLAADLFEGGLKVRALRAFQQFMKQYPHSQLKASAHYNVAYLYFTLYKYDSARLTFRQILEQPYNERDANDFMEPYKLYKHNTCRMLAQMAVEQEDYQEAANYIKMFDEEFPYQHFCGNEWSAYDMYKAVMLAKVHKGMKKPELAMRDLLPYVFDDGLASNEEVVDELVDLVKQIYSADQITQELNSAMASITIQTKNNSDHAYIKLFGTDVPVRGWIEEEDTKIATVEQYRKVVQESAFFGRLQ
jgi:tetratricopeptide (TPR) repeat protein